MQIEINGEHREVDDGIAVAALLQALGLGEQGVAVLVNGALIARPAWREHHLAADDQVEVVRMVGGG